MNAICMLEPEHRSGSVGGQVDGMDENLEVRFARLESDVKHIQSDVSDIKVEVRRLNDKIDGVKSELTGNIEGVRSDLTGSIEGLRSDLTGKIEGLRSELSGRIDAIKTELASIKMWALGLYVGLAASLLFVMAKGFKWL